MIYMMILIDIVQIESFCDILCMCMHQTNQCTKFSWAFLLAQLCLAFWHVSNGRKFLTSDWMNSQRPLAALWRLRWRPYVNVDISKAGCLARFGFQPPGCHLWFVGQGAMVLFNHVLITTFECEHLWTPLASMLHASTQFLQIRSIRQDLNMFRSCWHTFVPAKSCTIMAVSPPAPQLPSHQKGASRASHVMCKLRRHKGHVALRDNLRAANKGMSGLEHVLLLPAIVSSQERCKEWTHLVGRL